MACTPAAQYGDGFADGATSGNALIAWGLAMYHKSLLFAIDSSLFAGGETCDAELVVLSETLSFTYRVSPTGPRTSLCSPRAKPP